MQLTLDDLRKSNDPLALLLAMSDSDLDRVAAEVVGFRREKGTLLGELIESWRDHKNATIFDYEWKPSRDLTQAYEVLGYCRLKCGHYHSRVEDWDDTYHTLGRPMEDVFDLNESQAGSHARAIVVLAILGLLGKDGAA